MVVMIVDRRLQWHGTRAGSCISLSGLAGMDLDLPNDCRETSCVPAMQVTVLPSKIRDR